MHNAVSVVDVRDSLHPKLDRRLNRHEKREEEASVRQVVAEAIDEEKEDRDELGHHSALYELSQHDFGASMSQRAMLEEKIGQPVQVLHLNVGASEHV